jgi:hypothetical protein
MVSKCVVFVFAAVALAGCCASGTSCDVPMAGPHVASDGLGPDPNDNVRPKKVSRPRQASVRPTSEVQGERKPQTKDEWEQQQAADRADEARLSKRMMICSGCSAQSSEGGGGTGSVSR